MRPVTFRTAILALVAALAMAIALPAVAQDPSPPSEEITGIWGAGFSNPNTAATISANLVSLGQNGLLMMEARNWGAFGDGNATCVYAVSFDAAGFVTGPLDAYTATATCPARFAGTITRSSPYEVVLEFDTASAALLEDIASWPMLIQRGPASTLFPAKTDPDLDVLGVRPGMTAEEVRSLLAPKGFTETEPETVSRKFDDSSTFSQSKLTFTKPDKTDTISVVMSHDLDWTEDTPVVMVIDRALTLDPAAANTRVSLLDSLKTKYGPTVSDSRFDPGKLEWRFGPEGPLDSCQASLNLIGVGFYLSEQCADLENAGCTQTACAKVRVDSESVPQTLTVLVSGNTLLLSDDWAVQSRPHAVRLAQILAAADDKPVAPEL